MTPITRRERWLIEDEDYKHEQFLEKWDERHKDDEEDTPPTEKEDDS